MNGVKRQSVTKCNIPGLGVDYGTIQPMTNEKALEYLVKVNLHHWDKYSIIYPILKSKAFPIIQLNNRFRTTSAMCYYVDNRIEYSAKLFAKHYEFFFSDVIPHELAHLVVHYITNGKNEYFDHGPIFKNVMLKYGVKPSTYFNY